MLAELFSEERFSSAVATKATGSGRYYSLHTFVKKPLELFNSESLFGNADTETGQALATTIEAAGKTSVEIINVHGVPFPGHKLDTEGRLRQTERIIMWLDASTPPAVVCGDFNLLPEAESVTKLTAAGYRNLIAEYAIPTTRNQLAWKNYPDNKQLFADYTFTSPKLTVTGFSVPDIEVSDHLPMITTLKI